MDVKDNELSNKSIFILLLLTIFSQIRQSIKWDQKFGYYKNLENKSDEKAAQNNKWGRNFSESKQVKSANDDNNIYNTNGVQSCDGNIFYEIEERSPHNSDDDRINAFERTIDDDIFF